MPNNVSVENTTFWKLFNYQKPAGSYYIINKRNIIFEENVAEPIGKTLGREEIRTLII